MTVPPRVWFGFKGRSLPYSILLNIANIPHDPTEVEHRNIDEVNYSWKVNESNNLAVALEQDS